METLKNTLTQIRRVWERSSRGNRVATVVLGLASLAAVLGVGVWSLQPQFVPLATSLAPRDLADVISRLESENIPYQLNHAGTAVSVPKAQWNSARLTVGDALPAEHSRPSFEEGSPLDSPGMSREKLLRNKEMSLETTIGSMHSIKHATVHISQQHQDPFMRPSDKTRASVVLEFERGRSFSAEQAESIVQMVSHAIEGLSPENVSVTSTRGDNLIAHRSGIDSIVERQFEYRRRIEAYLASKAESMLSRMFGLDKAIVRVTADIDFRKLTTTQTTYDPDGRVVSKETTETKSRSHTTRAPIGPAGTSSNLGKLRAPGSGPGLEKEETLDAEYKVPQTVEELITEPGAIKRMTVAATVDLSSAGEGAQVTIEQIEALIQVATGFDETRADSIKVIEASLPSPEPLIQEPDWWGEYRDVVQVVSLGVASLVAVVLGFLTLRRIKPITVAGDEAGGAARRARLLAEIANRANQDPDTVSRIVAAWMDEPTPPAEDADSPSRAAA